jgi:hypothetical protein
MTGQLAKDDMDKAATDRIEQQVRLAFPEGAIARVQVLQYGDDPEVEPGHAAVRAFFDWPGRSEGGKADPKTVHRFVTANAAALDVLRDGLPLVIGWVEFGPEGQAGAASPHSLAYRPRGLSMKIPQCRSESWTEHSSLSRDRQIAGDVPGGSRPARD